MTDETKARVDRWMDWATIISIFAFLVWIFGVGMEFVADLINGSIANR